MEEELKKNEISPIFRWIVLGIMSFVIFAAYYVYDAIGPLAEPLKKSLNLTNAQFGLLYTWYSVGNVFLGMIFFSGIILDKIGIKKAGILFTLITLFGTFLTSLGAMPELRSIMPEAVYNFLDKGFLSYWNANLKLMLLGRMFYGIGAEAIIIVNNKVIARWFKGKELAFAYGINLTICRLGTWVAFNLSPRIKNWTNWKVAMWAITIIMLIGTILFFVYLFLEKYAEKRVSLPPIGKSAEVFKLSELFKLGKPFWYITLLCVTFYSAIFPFTAFSTIFLQHKFGMSDVEGGFFTSLVITATMIFTPIFGLIVDKKGKRASIMVWGSLLLVPAHLLLGFTNIFPAIPMFVLGIALSLVPAALWAAIPLMVDEKKLGTAFGILGYIQNIGLMIFPWIAGKIIDLSTVKSPYLDSLLTSINLVLKKYSVSTTDYRYVMLMFSMLGFVGFFFALLLKRADKKVKEKGGMSIEDVVRS